MLWDVSFKFASTEIIDSWSKKPGPTFQESKAYNFHWCLQDHREQWNSCKAGLLPLAFPIQQCYQKVQKRACKCICCSPSDLPGRLKRALLLWPFAKFTWRSISRLLNNFALVSLCKMIHLCKIAIPNGSVFESGSQKIQLNHICCSLQSKKKNHRSAETVTGLCVWVLPLPMALPPACKIAGTILVFLVEFIKQTNKNL